LIQERNNLKATHLALGGVTVETGLSGSVSPALAVVGRVESKIEIHNFAFELEGRGVVGRLGGVGHVQDMGGA
jgi:hypothetical protein